MSASKSTLAVYLFVLALLLTVTTGPVAQGQGGAVQLDRLAATTATPQEAPAAFDGESNGLTTPAEHTTNQADFEEVEEFADGLGPVFNARSCADCHQNPVVGSGSQVSELRVGSRDRFGRFVAPDISVANGAAVIRGRSLVNDRAACPNAQFADTEVQEHAPDSAAVRTFRMSISTLGDGFVEALSSNTLIDLAGDQCRRTGGVICGLPILVPVGEANGALRVGRFGWKNQHASLLSFSADAYLNEMGITSRLAPQDVLNLCDIAADPEDHADASGIAGIDRFAAFMRATKAPPRDRQLSASIEAQVGAHLFDRVGCDTCHVPNMTTAPAGSVINGGAFTVPDALGNKIFHPYGDFLLHNVGTGDGIVQNGGQASATRMRTAPLWGVRTRSRLMHDGQSLTFDDAIQRHAGEAAGVRRNFNNLSPGEKQMVFAFLRSL